MHTRVPWSPVICAWLRKKQQQGWTIKRMAYSAEVSETTIQRWLKRCALRNQNLVREHARKLGVPELETSDWLLARKDRGNLSFGAICRELGISDKVLVRQIKLLGLEPEDFKGVAHPPKKRRTVELDCFYCGQTFTRPAPVNLERPYYCSRKCKGKWLAENHGFKKK